VTPTAILATLAADGIRIEVDGVRLLARPAAALTDGHRALIRAAKADLVRLLTERHHTWDVTGPDGDCWRSCVSPPMTCAELLAAYPRGTEALPVADPDSSDALPADVLELVNGWLDRIGEDDPQTRREALQLARERPAVREIYRRMGGPPAPPGPAPDAPGDPDAASGEVNP